MSENINVDENRLKITFADKIDSWTLTSQKEYVLTADNINEIKRVVNSISNELQGMDHFSSIYKYARFIVPTSLSRGASYDFELQMSSDSLFTNSEDIATIRLSQDPSKFFKFTNGQWINLANASSLISTDDIGSSIRVNIEALIAHRLSPYFGRFKFINSANGYETEWNGFSLGAFDYRDINVDDALNEIQSCYITGPMSMNEKSFANFSVMGVKRNGEVVDVTSNSTFDTLRQNTVEGSQITFKKSHKDNVDIIIATTTIDGATFKSAMPVLVKAITLDHLEIKLNDGSQLSGTVAKSFTADAVYSDGSKKTDVQSQCIRRFDIVSGALDIQNNNISCSALVDEFGALTLQYQDSDFPETEKVTGVKYIQYIADKIVSLSTNIQTVFDFDIVNGSPAARSMNFDVAATTKFGSTQNLKDAKFKIINGEELTIAKREENTESNIWTISIDPTKMLANKKATIVISDKDDLQTILVPITITGKTLQKLEMTFKLDGAVIEAAPAGSVVQYLYVERFNDNSSDTFSQPDSIESLTDNCVINPTAKTITVNDDVDNEIVIIKATRTYREKTVEQLFSFNATSKKPTGLTISGDAVVSVGVAQVPVQYTVKAKYASGAEVNVMNNENLKIRLLVGQSNLVSISSTPGLIIFKPIPSAQVSFTFLATFKERGVTVSKMFTVIVNHAS